MLYGQRRDRVALLAEGPNQGAHFSVPNLAALWALAAVSAVPLAFACRWFVRLKARSHSAWRSYL